MACPSYECQYEHHVTVKSVLSREIPHSAGAALPKRTLDILIEFHLTPYLKVRYHRLDSTFPLSPSNPPKPRRWQVDAAPEGIVRRQSNRPWSEALETP